MNKLKIFFPAFFLGVTVLATALNGCKKDKEELDINSPAYKISESEKLTIPASIAVPVTAGGNSRVATYYADGVQRYKAQAKAGSPGLFEWVFVAPQATLYLSNTVIGTHGAGPFWEVSPADSLFAQAFTPARTAPSPDANSIDWLLLKTKEGKPSTGLFSQVSYIQRIATVGGKAPAVAPTSEWQTAAVRYTAVYRFTKTN
jgi:hypothetical protein